MRRRKKGFAIAFVLLTLFVLSVLGFALGSRGTISLSQVYHTRQLEEAYYAAQAGLTLGLFAVSQQDSHLPHSCGQIFDIGVQGAPGNMLQGQALPQVLPNNASFDITVTNNYNYANPVSGCGASAPAPDGTLVPNGMVYITSRGIIQDSTRISNVMATVSTQGIGYNYAEVGKNGILASGGMSTDSYYSACGAYGARVVGPPPGCPLTAGSVNDLQNGNIATNNNAAGSVSMSGNGTIHGQVSVGPGGRAGSPTISASGNARYNSAQVLSSAIAFPTITDPVPSPPDGGSLSCSHPCSMTDNYYDDIKLQGQATLTLSCGQSYSFNTLSISGQAQLIIPGTCSETNPVKVYVRNTGDGSNSPINFSGGSIVNGSSVPGALQMFDLSSQPAGCNPEPPSFNTSGCAIDTVSGGTDASYTLYAPNSVVDITGNSAIQGSLIGLFINDSGGAGIHYDQDLSNLSLGSAGVNVVAKLWNFR